MRLSSLLNTNLIFLNVEGETRESVYLDIIKRISDNKITFDCTPEELTRQVIEREDIVLIPYEKSFAFPHLRLGSLRDLHIAVGILDKPLQLKPNDISETQIIILFLISSNTSQVYLKALSTFTKFLLKKGNAAKLINTETPEEFINVLNSENVEIKHTITAEDIMNTNFPYVKENDQITKVLDIFAAERRVILPVIDENNSFIGQIDAFDLIERSIPKYMMLLDNHQFLKSFEPFENIINDENSTYVKDYLSEPEMIIPPDTPLIQLTLLLLKKTLKNLFVVKDGSLLGIVTMQEIINNVLRG